MNWFFIIIVAMGLINTGIVIGKWNERRNDKYGWGDILGNIIQIVLIYFAVRGGFS